MSDILIKNMKMPESCHDCCLTDGWNCYTSLEYKDNEAYCDSKTKPDWCPLVEVPPHGRLIDADALTTYPKPIGKLMMYGGEYVYTQTAIDDAPTIIEAEGE